MINPIVDKIKKFEKQIDELDRVTKEDLESAIRKYFYNKYSIAVKSYVYGSTFSFEKDLDVAYNSWLEGDTTEYSKRTRQFNFSIDVLYKFAKDFDAEFSHTACDGNRYIFKFKNIDGKKVFRW